MKTTTLVLAISLATFSIAALPAAEAAPGCLVGSEGCLVTVSAPVCVTEPCDAPKVCVGWDAACVRLG